MFMGFGLIFTLLIIVAIIYALNEKLVGQDSPFFNSKDTSSPVDIAQRRYASGEITKEEYEEIRQDL